MTHHRTIALDLDSTLAASVEAALSRLPTDATPSDVTDWYWGPERFGLATWLDAFWDIWRHDPLTVAPLEPDLDRLVSDLTDYGAVDIVTAHPDDERIDAGKRAWLEYHAIPHDAFVTVDTDASKLDLGYDWYIDDKPGLVEDATAHETTTVAADAHAGTDAIHVFVRDQPYNHRVTGTYTRVGTLAAVHPTQPAITIP